MKIKKALVGVTFFLTVFAFSVGGVSAHELDGEHVHDHEYVVEETDAGIFHGIGEVLAFPFRLVGNVLDALF